MTVLEMTVLKGGGVCHLPSADYREVREEAAKLCQSLEEINAYGKSRHPYLNYPSEHSSFLTILFAAFHIVLTLFSGAKPLQTFWRA